MPQDTLYNEAELLSRLAAGEQQAYRELFDRYWDQVYAVALKLSKSPELAKDLAQETFIRIWNYRDRLSEVQHFNAFINTLSRNLAIDHLRKKVFATANEDYLVDYFSDEASTPHEKAEYKELEQLLHRAVNHLPPQMQQVFRLSRFEGLSHAEIAMRMNITRVTSKSYMVRALGSIRQYLSQHGEDRYLLIISMIWLIP